MADNPREPDDIHRSNINEEDIVNQTDEGDDEFEDADEMDDSIEDDLEA